MIYGKRVLWAINVYSGIAHLHQQEEILRHVFGNEITILVFCNHDDKNVKPRYREDRLSRMYENSGHHNGVRDAHNDTLGHLNEFDLVISTHADSFFQDYSIVPEIVKKMVDDGKKLAVLQAFEGENPHTRRVGPAMYNDFFVADARMWERAGEIREGCDGHGEVGIEATLARHFLKVITHDDVMIVPARFEDQNHPHRFIDTWRPGVNVLRENNKTVKDPWIRANCPEYRAVLEKVELL